MFDATIKAETLKDVVAVVSTLVDEVKLNISKKGISLKAVDPAHVAMVNLSLHADAFEHLKATECELGLDIDKLKDVLKLALSDDTVTLHHDEERNRLVVGIGNVTRRMSLVDTTGMSDPQVPNLALPAHVTLATADLTRGIRASESVSDHIVLVSGTDHFELSSEGDTDSVDLRLEKDQLVEIDCKEPVRSLFSLDYFSNMIKSIGAAETVSIHLGTNFPVMIKFKIAGDKGDVTYLLAPRIEND